MAQFETWVDSDLKKPVMMHFPNGLMFSEDSSGNLIGVNVFSDGEPVTLSGTVTGYCILANGASIPVSGVRSSNKASVVIPSTAYKVPGQIVIVIKITDGSQITTLAAVSATVVGIGDVPADPTQSTIDDWTAMITTTLETVQNNSVRFDTTQTLTTAEKTRARNNIGANSSVTLISGEDYRIAIP